MDTSFIGKPHEWDPRRVYSQTGADWQYRVDFDRLRKDRLQRAREEMTKRDLGALVLFAGANIRYVTASYQGNWKYNINIRYAVLPNGGEPVLFETAGSDLQCAIIDLPWMEGRIRPAMTWQWAEGAVPMMADKMVDSVIQVLDQYGLRKEQIGLSYAGRGFDVRINVPFGQTVKEALIISAKECVEACPTGALAMKHE